MVAVATVRGEIDSSELGLVLPHEHLVCDTSGSYSPTGIARYDELLAEGVSPGVLWLLRDFPTGAVDNCRMDDLESVLGELQYLRELGPATVIELTTPSEGRSISTLKDLSRASGVHIIAGSGWYIEPAESVDTRAKTVEDHVSELISDLTDEASTPGVIGEIGISPSFTPFEERSLRAAAIAQVEVSKPLFIHLPGWQRYGNRVLDIVLRDHQVNPRAVVLCHMDPSGMDVSYQMSLADRGVNLEFDMIGMPYFYRGMGEGQSPSVAETCKAIAGLVRQGHASQILVSHDMGLKSMLSVNGGNGLKYVPRLLADRLSQLGCAEGIVRRFMTDNVHSLFVAARQ